MVMFLFEPCRFLLLTYDEKEVNGNISYWRKPLFEGMFRDWRFDKDAGGLADCCWHLALKDKYQECVCLIYSTRRRV